MTTTASTDDVIVLGAAGFVGRHVARTLSRLGRRVLGIGHGSWPEAAWRAWGLSGWTQADIGFESLEGTARAGIPRAVVHCGGSGTVSYSYAHPLQDFQRATQSTAAVLEWARLRGEGRCRVVLVSSAAVYGDQGDTDATETSVRAPISPYGFHKLAAESLCDSYNRFFGVPVSVVRLFSVYGEGLQKQLLWDALNRFRAGENRFLGTGHELRDWLHVDDAAHLLARAALAPQAPAEIYNGGGEQAAIRDVLARLARGCGFAREIVFSGETHAGNPRRLTASTAHTARLLDWRPAVGLDEGLARYVTWFGEQAREAGAAAHPPARP